MKAWGGGSPARGMDGPVVMTERAPAAALYRRTLLAADPRVLA